VTICRAAGVTIEQIHLLINFRSKSKISPVHAKPARGHPTASINDQQYRPFLRPAFPWASGFLWLCPFGSYSRFRH
jgi:hypothetical protein